MRAVPAAPGSTTAQVSAEQLVAMAVAAEIAAATPRLEVYPRGLDAGRAVRLASGALSGVAQLTPAQVAERVAARFPAAAALPDHPELDALLDTASVPLRWDDEESRYLARRVEPAGLTSLTRPLCVRLR